MKLGFASNDEWVSGKQVLIYLRGAATVSISNGFVFE